MPVSFPWIFDRGPDVGEIHAGFGHALRDAWDKIRQAVDNLIPPPELAPGRNAGTHTLAYRA